MKIKVLGCGVFEPELEALIPHSPHDVDFEPLEAGLHEVPNELRVRLQAAIDQAGREGYDVVALAYGLCGRGTSGLIARDVTLVIPRVHDCLTLFLGSREEYRKQFREHPGTYYITPGWFTRKMGMDQTGRPRSWTHDVRENPRFQEFSEQYGEQQAEEILGFLGSWKRNYTRVAVIDTGCGEVEGCTQLAGQISENLGWACESISGDTEMLSDLVSGDWDDDRFVVVEPGQR
ncbi:MAG: DUF1638 domain-containing protein, partial [Armatimonadia bacterium]|nr:DUF1638 domain-containing protein [Armatimonadia bacterium]